VNHGHLRRSSFRGGVLAGARAREQPLVHFHFTPKGSSWLNQIETWFGVITRQAIRRGTFASVQVLVRAIRAYIASWNTNPRPFQWTATADEILAKVRLTQINIKKLVANNSM
jgi:transposase